MVHDHTARLQQNQKNCSGMSLLVASVWGSLACPVGTLHDSQMEDRGRVAFEAQASARKRATLRTVSPSLRPLRCRVLMQWPVIASVVVSRRSSVVQFCETRFCSVLPAVHVQQCSASSHHALLLSCACVCRLACGAGVFSCVVCWHAREARLIGAERLYSASEGRSAG